MAGIIKIVLILALVFGLYKWWLYSTREKSCRNYATAMLELDDKYPLNGQERTSGYYNVGKYKEMYDECMFLQNLRTP